ncbi:MULTISPECIES: hypothetical protein [Caulobacter]|nr:MULTISPECIES: hypothetical protein [Caulobacter]MBQ1559653.1 hypothetical protein [Caulobacter sp.]
MGDAAMNVSKMNHAMLSFALIGGMLVGRPSPKPAKSSSSSTERK